MFLEVIIPDLPVIRGCLRAKPPIPTTHNLTTFSRINTGTQEKVKKSIRMEVLDRRNSNRDIAMRTRVLDKGEVPRDTCLAERMATLCQSTANKCGVRNAELVCH